MRFAIIKPLLFMLTDLVNYDLELILSETQFLLLVLSVIAIAAGGYIINDHHDQEEDRVNKPNKLNTTSLTGYYILTAIGLIIGFGLAIQLGNYNYGLFHLAAAISLWFYATYFKGSILLGNFIIALCVGMVPLVVGVYEVTQLQFAYPDLVDQFQNFNFNFVAFWMVGYAVFGFLFTLSREAIKDAEDWEGDAKAGKNTLPVSFGINASRIWITLVNLCIVYSLWYVYQNFLSDKLTLLFASILSVFLVIQALLVWIIKTQKKWHLQSTLSKVFSAFGLLYALGVAYMMYNGIWA